MHFIHYHCIETIKKHDITTTLNLTLMHTKLKLIVMALCIASVALAQTPKTSDVTKEEEEQATLSDQAFTFTETQLGEYDDMA